MEIQIKEMSSDENMLLIKDMEAMLGKAKQPKLEPNCCIYKVPYKIREINPVAYTPHVVSIGPLHREEKRLYPMEDLKLGYLMSFLERRTHAKLEDFIEKLKKKEEDIRSCYAETTPQSSDDFVKMILIDGCFIIEYIWRFIEFSPWNKSDPIISNPYRVHDIDQDLILLENQLPFFVLEELFAFTSVDGKQYSSFLEVAFLYFRKYHSTIDKPGYVEFRFDDFCEHYLKKRDGEHEEVKVLHITDLLRILYLPRPELLPVRKYGFVKHLYSASQLLEAGVKFEVSQNKSLIELQFENGVLTIPELEVDDDIEILLRNMMALEQCHYPYDSYISDYISLIDFLINERKDVDILVDQGIMVNLLGDNDKVVAIFNNICMGTMAMDCNVDHLNLSENLNDFYDKPLHKYKAIFIRDYLSTPWKIASFIAAIILLLLTLIQTISSII